MENKERFKMLVDLERLNTLTEGCLACGHKFNLGDQVVLARGKWQGFKYIHENEAVFDKTLNKYYERSYYTTMKNSLGDEG